MANYGYSKKVLKNTVWGYENKNHQIFRYNKEWEKFYVIIEKTPKAYIYIDRSNEYRSRGEHYYFSVGLNGKIYFANKKNVNAVLGAGSDIELKKYIN